ncbi:MAG: hypothetical protein QF482_02940 [Candidatus Poseidoniia archaeon]|jgi:membrane protein DedA with SNARE-associated domain|nr:hypothetical protein [Candidatus Poseidoniia archaeon]
MALLSYTVYKLMHIFGAFLIVAVYAALGLWVMNERSLEENKYEKLGLAAHGIGLLLVVLAGFGMLASLYPEDSLMSFGWVHVKLTLWLMLGGGITLLRKKPEHASTILLVALLVTTLAAAIGVNHYSWFGN